MRSKDYVEFTRWDLKTKESFDGAAVAKLIRDQKNIRNIAHRARERSPFSQAKIWEEFEKPAQKRSRKKDLDNISYVRLNNGMIMKRVSHAIAKSEGRIRG